MASTEGKRLYRSTTNRMLGGVCGGIGEHINVDPTIIRLVLIIFTLAGGAGILFYIIAWLVIPERPIGSAQPTPPPTAQTA